MTTPVVLEIDHGVATLTIAREERRNSLDHVAMRRLEEALVECAAGAAGVLIVTGAGGRAFCAGDDVKAYAERTQEESRAHHERGLRTFDALERFPGLTIAAVDGYCIGGGLELALCCDLRIAGAGATFGLPEIPKLDALPSWGGLTRLPRIIGIGRAKQMAFLGERIDAAEALRIGLVARVVEAGEALANAQAFAADFAAKVHRDTVDVAKRILTDSTAIPSTAATLVNLLAERSNAFEGA